MDTVTFVVPASVVKRWEITANKLWDEDEQEENYEDAVTCGNADDSYYAGEDQGSAAVASEILGYKKS